MIELIQGIDTSKIRAWLERDIRGKLTTDVSNYAKNRLRAWLRTEPPLGKGDFRPGIPISDGMWTRLQEIIKFRFDFCLVTFSGDMGIPIGITPHRDASYANYEAMGLNVSGTCKFSYWNDRQSFGRSASSGNAPFPGNPTDIIYMNPGDMVRFNCKNIHSAEPSINRWNMNFWQEKG